MNHICVHCFASGVCMKLRVPTAIVNLCEKCCFFLSQRFVGEMHLSRVKINAANTSAWDWEKLTIANCGCALCMDCAESFSIECVARLQAIAISHAQRIHAEVCVSNKFNIYYFTHFAQSNRAFVDRQPLLNYTRVEESRSWTMYHFTRDTMCLAHTFPQTHTQTWTHENVFFSSAVNDRFCITLWFCFFFVFSF